MANLIILEGVSRTGKSSISKKLSSQFRYRNISISNKNPDYIENFPDFYHGMHMISLEFFKAFPNETFILDRSFLSELVYSSVFNRNTHVKKDFICDLLHDNNFILVNLTTSHDEYLNRLPKDRKIYTLEEFEEQRIMFFEFFEIYRKYYDNKNWQDRFMEINTNLLSIDECSNLIIEKSKLINNLKVELN